MIERYTLPEMGKVWSEENKFNNWLKIEILVTEILCKQKKVPKWAINDIKNKAKFALDRIRVVEEEVKHDVIAFLTVVNENIGPASRYLHMGLTSSDILDTALSLQMKESASIILNKLNKAIKVVKEKAKEHKYTLMIGRTHGIHAEPITFGCKLAIWWKELERAKSRFLRAKEIISYGKISGPVGTYTSVDPSVEEYVCKKLGIKPAPVSSQIIQRDRHAEYLTSLAILASSLEKFATEIRHLQKTEVLEAEEPFGKGQKGSSAMPHKRNPVVCERICGLARVVRTNAMASLENIALWHERDISHSSTERVIIPDSAILVDYILQCFIYVISGLLVYPENMIKNINKTNGLIYSANVMLALVKNGISREEAYKLVQRNAMKCWRSGKSFAGYLKRDKEVAKLLKSKELEKCFVVKPYMKNIPKIFKRLGL